jgi:hypothetical protein
MNSISKEEWRWAAVRAALFIAVATLPYIIVYLATPADLFYTGFLSNPEDGHSYLAKMRQGMRGDWLFHLPYTPEPHQGEFLFTYYLALGHLSRWLSIPPILIFHLARIVNGFLLLLVLYYAVACCFQDRSQRRFAFTITALGSGFGWLATLLGHMTADMWVPEGYIFYSLFANPHFPLAIALILLLVFWSVTPWGTRRPSWRRLIALLPAAALLGLVQPFCLLSVGVVLVLYALILWVEKRLLPWREVASLATIGTAGLPFVLNAYLATIRNPAFAAWSAQNQTPSPPPWDMAASYGIVLILALVGLRFALWRRRDSDWLLGSWAVSTALLLYAPFSLQRRLVMGLIVPLGLLATMGWCVLTQRRRLRQSTVWAFAGLTHLLLIAITLVGALAHSGPLFMTRDEHAALSWLATHAPQDALVLSAPQTGLYIPAWAGQRVLYGHRFETSDAERRRAEVERFFQANASPHLGSAPGEDLQASLQPDYVLYGPREQALSQGNWQPDPTWQVVYQQGSVTLYALPKE